MADMFPSFSIIRKCVFIFHEQHNHGWNVPATFHSQRVRIPISWAVPSWLIWPCYFRLPGSAYLYFMSSSIMTDLFLPFLLSGSAYLYFMSSTITLDMFLPLMALSGYAFPLSSRRYQVWLRHVSAIFYFQEVRINISWAAQSWLTYSCHFWLSVGA